MASNGKAMEIVGYADRLSVAAGESIAFKVSSYIPGRYKADLVRIVSADRTPGGAGFEEHVIDAAFSGEYEGRAQTINYGSHGVVELPSTKEALANLAGSGFTLQAMIYPTTPTRGRQGICGTWHGGAGLGASLAIDEGQLALVYADIEGATRIVHLGRPLLEARWQLVAASYDGATRTLTLMQWPVIGHPADCPSAEPLVVIVPLDHDLARPARQFLFAGLADDVVRPDAHDGLWIASHFNGKLDHVRWSGASLDRAEIERLNAAASPPADQSTILGFWDFSRDIPTEHIRDLGPFGLAGRTVNLPSRATTGSNWNGTEHDWRHAPDQYGAIHFHDDDVHDCAWETDFTFTVPDALSSGIYAARLTHGEHEYRIPFFVRVVPALKRAPIAFVMSTATYLAYANSVKTAELLYLATQDSSQLNEVFHTLKAHPEFGLSTYDTHSDGSGVRYSSRLRPLVDVQPGTTKTWALQADLLVTAWLERSGYAFDIVTDEDLHRDGAEALEGYRLVITGSHPEYMSLAMRQAFDKHLATSGRLIYLGGNGFYMRVAFSDSITGAMEMRRVAQSMVGLWNERPGDHYFSFTGELGGLWQNLHLPPEASVGVGFSNLLIGTNLCFEPTAAAVSPRARFIFSGVEGAIRNDFGEIYGPLGSDEFDRWDPNHGSPRHALVVATAVRQQAEGPFDAHYQADMTFFETPSGGAVFSTACISWGLGLNHKDRANDVSRAMANVVDRFIDPTPFPYPGN